MTGKKSTGNFIFIISLIIVMSVALYSILASDSFSNVADSAFRVLTKHFSWMYLLVMFLFVIFVFLLAISKYGYLKLGAEDAKPEYSTFSWFAMLFCAGMGVGLVFWGISEPISHYINPVGAESGTPEAAAFAFKSVFMHWGIHPWANYAVLGLALAYFQFRKGHAGLISSTLSALLGERNTTGFLGKIVDILGIFATVAGVATSLGLGVMQITTGLNKLVCMPDTTAAQVIIICIITLIFLASALSGIGKGIKLLSNANIILAVFFVTIAVIVGPKTAMLNNFTEGLGNYLNSFVKDSLAISAYGDNSWLESWRVFYWAWWIAWAPFVGAFIARISYGRTIREFIIGVVLAPTAASIVWFTVFGTMGIHLGESDMMTLSELGEAASAPEAGLFVVLQQYPMGTVLSFAAILLLFIFFITSADSGTYVLAMLSSNGAKDPSVWKKLTWGAVQTLLAIGLLLSGGLKPLQTISIVAAFPFMFVMVGACISLWKALQFEYCSPVCKAETGEKEE